MSIDQYWLPLGAGGRSVRLNGRVFEAIQARLERRQPLDLYHSALEVSVPEGRFVIEMAPVRDADGALRGVVGKARWEADVSRAFASSATRYGVGGTASSPTSARRSQARSG